MLCYPKTLTHLLHFVCVIQSHIVILKSQLEGNQAIYQGDDQCRVVGLGPLLS